jgi:hypothetical protein
LATWGVEDNVRERFGAAGVPAENDSQRETYVFRRLGLRREFFHALMQYHGPTMNTFEAANKDGQADQLETELTQLCKHHDHAGADKSGVPATFLKVTITRT